MSNDATAATPLERRYLDLLAGALTRSLFDEVLVPLSPLDPRSTWKKRAYGFVRRLLGPQDIVLARRFHMEDVLKTSPPAMLRNAETMIGPLGLDNLRVLIETVLNDDVPGDLIEAGAWRGGSAIFMRGVLEAHADPTRAVWVADSFVGLPERTATGYREDLDDRDWAKDWWFAASLADVRNAFERYGLLDERTHFLVGWFKDTLPRAPIERLALMRLDGDMYGSTMDALTALYPKLSVGGFVVIDDYWLPNCRAAVDDFRRANDIADDLIRVDRAIAYWRRSG